MLGSSISGWGIEFAIGRSQLDREFESRPVRYQLKPLVWASEVVHSHAHVVSAMPQFEVLSTKAWFPSNATHATYEGT